MFWSKRDREAILRQQRKNRMIAATRAAEKKKAKQAQTKKKGKNK